MYKCRICKNEENNLEFYVQEMMYGLRERFDYFQCANCGCLQIGNIPADIAKYYPSNYYSFNNAKAESAFARFFRHFRDRFAVLDKGLMGKLLYKLKPNVPLKSLANLGLVADMKILDVGCGSGSLLCSLEELGFKNLLGVDPFISEDVVIKDRLRIVKKELVDVGGKWDVVMFHHSFEHMLNQLEALQHVKNILDENGSCLIRIPTVSSFAWRHYGVNWVQLDAPRHFYLHSIQSMAILAKSAGLYIDRVVYDSESFQFWGSELTSKGIPLIDQNSGKPNSKASIFSASELRKYSAEADRLNALQDGDQAAFYLKRLTVDCDGGLTNSLPEGRGCFNVSLPHVGESLERNVAVVHQRTRLPNIFVVGTAKAGTSSIGDYLSRHPAIYISPIKEPHFFSEDFRMADFRADYRKRASFDVKAYLKNHPLPHKHIAYIDDESQYLELFREVKNEKTIGELSTGYLYSSCAAENLFKFNPDAKIVMVLRQPVERAYSHYLMDVRDLWSCDSGFINALERDFASSEKGWGKSHLYVELGLYFEQVSRYLKRFPESQIKIFLYEDFKNDPVGFIKELCEFLEVDPSALSAKDVAVHKNVAALPRFKIPGAYLPIFNVLRGYTGMLLPDKIKLQIRKVMFSSKNVPKLREDEFEQAMRYFNEDIQKLSVLIKRDLQSWHQMSK